MFETSLPEFITILGMCAATYSSRLLGYLFLRKREISPRLRTVLDAAPGCVMVSVVAPAFMTTDPADLISLAAAVLVASRANLAVTVVAAVALNALLHHIVF